MKKTLTFLLSTMMLSATLAGCASEDSSGTGSTDTNSSTNSSSNTATADTGATNTTSDEVSEKAEDNIITMGGSTSVEEIVSAMMQVYMADTGIDITYSGTGSSTGVSGALEGTLDLGLASRDLKDSEASEGAEAVAFAYDGIAVIVNTANPIADLTTDELAQIFKKEVTNWSELGGDDGQIVVVGRDAASGTRGAFEEILAVTDETLYDSEQSATGSVISTVAGNPNAIGYVSLSAVEDQVAAIAVDGVFPSEETVKDTSYPIQRPFIFVINSAVNDSEVNAFVEWATSEEVADLVTSKGCVAPN